MHDRTAWRPFSFLQLFLTECDHYREIDLRSEPMAGVTHEPVCAHSSGTPGSTSFARSCLLYWVHTGLICIFYSRLFSDFDTDYRYWICLHRITLMNPHQSCLQAKVKHQNDPKLVMPKSQGLSWSYEIKLVWTFDTEFPTIFNKS